jgi:murein DD-endopeptidase MepM/ murein hydrolase activator NlpD
MISRERGPRVLVMLVMLLGSVLASAAGADTTDDLTRARDRMVAAQAAADAAAARYEAALAGHAQLEDQLAQTQQRIAATEVRERVLTKQVQAIAARAYVNAGEPAVGALFSGNDLLDLGRSTRLLDRANAPNVATIDQLTAVHDDLDRDRARVAVAEKDSAQLLASLQAESNRVQQELAAAGNAKTQIEQRIEQVKQQAIQDAARATEARAVAGVTTTTTRPSKSTTTTTKPKTTSPTPTTKPTTTTTKPTTTTTKPTQPPPPSGNRVCPVHGPVSFVDSWGAPRSGGRTHQGVDMMAARGTPDVAIVSGTITQQYGSLQGNGVFLKGDDGNSYWYFHLDSYAGGPRRVAQGEVIGYVGTTGNAEGGAPHTHFEYHPGGGAAVDPYPIVRPIC